MSATSRPPQVLLPANGDVATVARDLTRQGWRVHPGFSLPAEPWDVGTRRLVAVGRVPNAATAQAALLCAVRGAGLVVAMDRDTAWAAVFLADLARIRPAVRPPAVTDGLSLSDEQRALLDLLAEGHSIAQAARRLYLSLRTANRRVAEARATLGVSTTREAVLAYVRLRGP
ncbi:MAG TPA: hypothetical protein VFX70_13210 [Mycobacteriales bacterium]|nr:hypothetical protein [Mycobacteriales bacterium]